ncbi:Phytosulfokines 3 [Rhynchospora pubera]|uniref:Phytosulfokine n=1 Tax=Rhynchospora pubera TaxID=906938 RepID=A0AAV8FB16_9POAL|nr:Phytosulfokines 3 [Rhynchospora pubera]KAJ4788048.1 Phytosulfokines 3 [Rhynchospora pubera]
MARQITIVLVAFLLFATLTQGARVPDAKTQHHKNVEKDAPEKTNSSCKGLSEEDCLAKMAHTDYIYTQDNHN